MIVWTSDSASAVGVVDAVDDADVFAGAAPIPGDPKEMGRVIHAVLSDRNKTAARR
jgi:hypothetical protein